MAQNGILREVGQQNDIATTAACVFKLFEQLQPGALFENQAYAGIDQQ